MASQPEQILEDNLVKQLTELSYEEVKINNEEDLILNFKNSLRSIIEQVYQIMILSRYYNFINKGNIFKRAGILRDRVPYINDNGENKTIELINQIHWCKNEFQVTRQVTMQGSYKNRMMLRS